MQGCFHKCENISNDDECVAYLASFLTSLLSLCYDNTNPFRTRKNSSRRQMRLICNNPRRAAPPKHGQEEQRLLARIRNMLIRSKEEKRCGKRPRRGGVWADDLSLAKTPQYKDEQRGHAGISPRRFFCKQLKSIFSSARNFSRNLTSALCL